jgi:ABC-type phosphate transport system substrate-binding protein
LRRTSIIAFSLILLTLSPAGSHSAVSADTSFVVIVHPEIKGDELPRVILSAIFLRKAPRWEDGLDVRPVDQSMSSPLRADFTTAVLDMPVNGLQRYWSQEIENGVQPPPVKGSDQEVIAYVASTPGAIGYVSAGVALPEGVKTMTLVE